MKGLTRRDFLKLSGATLLAASLPQFGFARAERPAPAPLLWRGSARHRYLALTYDDCYSLNLLHELERLLDEFPEYKITLFPVGTAILNLETLDPGIWKRFYDKGHEIGYHSWDHTNFGVMSAAKALEDYSLWFNALRFSVGFQPKVRFGRPTFGSLAASFNVVCREYGLVNTMWTTGWGGQTDDGLRAAHNSQNGDIVLLHIRSEDCKTSREAYPWLRENGWSAVTLSRLYNDLLLEQNNPEGCDVEAGISLNRTCIE